MSVFALLGLTDDATIAEVRQAYHNKARLLHPDLGGDPAEFAALRDAYADCVKAVENRKCVTCNGTKKVTHTVGWSSIETKCPTCG